jgi:hypothetical protein
MMISTPSSGRSDWRLASHRARTRATGDGDLDAIEPAIDAATADDRRQAIRPGRGRRR